MDWTPEAVVKKLGAEAQVVPGCIIVYRNKHIVVMEVDQNGFRLTAEGRQILEPVEPVAARKTKKLVDSLDDEE